MIRKTAFAALPLAAAVLLCACGAPAAQSAAADAATSDSAPAESEATAEAPAAADATGAQTAVPALHDIELGYFGISMGQDAAYAPMAFTNDDLHVATRIAYADGVQNVLCNREGCTHTDDTCPAFLYTATNHSVPGDAMIVDGEKLYWVVDGRFNESAGAYIDVSALDGSGRQRLAEGDALPDLSWLIGDGTASWYSDGDSLYFYGNKELGPEHYTGDHALYRVDESGLQTVADVPAQGGEELTPIGCCAGKLVLRPSEGGHLWTLDAAGTLTETEYAWDLYVCDTVGDTVYGVAANGKDLRSVDFAAGQTGTQAMDLPGKASYLNGRCGDWFQLWVDVSDPSDYENNERLVNVKTGECRNPATTWFKDHVESRAPVIQAGNEQMLLVMGDIHTYTMSTVGTDGVPYTHETDDGVYSFVTPESYLSDNITGTPLTLLSRDFVY